MNRTDRLYALVEELRAVAPRPRSAGWLARTFEVSTRTIERDLDALRQAGVPVYAEPGRSGGYVLDKRRTLVEPLGLLSGSSWYLVGWCRLRSALRGFRLDRIRWVERLREVPPARQVGITELDALGNELVGLDVMANTDTTVSPAR